MEYDRVMADMGVRMDMLWTAADVFFTFAIRNISSTSTLQDRCDARHCDSPARKGLRGHVVNRRAISMFQVQG